MSGPIVETIMKPMPVGISASFTTTPLLYSISPRLPSGRVGIGTGPSVIHAR